MFFDLGQKVATFRTFSQKCKKCENDIQNHWFPIGKAMILRKCNFREKYFRKFCKNHDFRHIAPSTVNIKVFSMLFHENHTFSHFSHFYALFAPFWPKARNAMFSYGFWSTFWWFFVILALFSTFSHFFNFWLKKGCPNRYRYKGKSGTG